MTFPLSSDLPSELKIRKSSEFKEVFESGVRLYTEHFTVIYSPNSLGMPRLGLVVGKRISLNAVERNRIKRILREVFRRNKSSFDSFDVLFMARKPTEKLDYTRAEREIVGAFRSEL